MSAYEGPPVGSGPSSCLRPVQTGEGVKLPLEDPLPYSITIKTGLIDIALPSGVIGQGGQTYVLTDAQYLGLSPTASAALFSSVVFSGGPGLQPASNLADLISAPTARTNLGLGNAAVRNTGTTSATVAVGDAPVTTVAAHATDSDPHGDRSFTSGLTGPLTTRVTGLEASTSTVSLGSTSGTVICDLSLGSTFLASVTGSTVFQFSGWPSGTRVTEPTVIATQDATGHSITFTGISWLPTGSPPPSFQVGANQVNITSFFSVDNGVTIYGQGGSATGGGFGVYGDGSDGAVILDGTNTYSFLGKSGSTYWLTRDTFFSAVSVASGVTLQLGGGGTAVFRLLCTGTASVASGGFLTTAINTAAAGATGGSNLTTGTMVPGANGPSGTTGGGVVGTSVAGANGGFGGRGGNANAGGTLSGLNGTSALPTGASLPRAIPWASALSYLVNGVLSYYPGGASGSPGAGDGTNAGGGAGAGGNTLWAAVQNLTNAGTIKSTGGNGAAGVGGNAGGGGGGQGGPVVLIYGAYSGAGTITSTGGNGGAAAGTGTAGASGGAGWIVKLVN